MAEPLRRGTRNVACDGAPDELAPRDLAVLDGTSSFAYLRYAHWPARACARTDHATEVAAAADREAEANVRDIVAVVHAVLDSLELSAQTRERALALASAEFGRLADPTRLPDRGSLPTGRAIPEVSRW